MTSPFAQSFKNRCLSKYEFLLSNFLKIWELTFWLKKCSFFSSSLSGKGKYECFIEWYLWSNPLWTFFILNSLASFRIQINNEQILILLHLHFTVVKRRFWCNFMWLIIRKIRINSIYITYRAARPLILHFIICICMLLLIQSKFIYKIEQIIIFVIYFSILHYFECVKSNLSAFWTLKILEVQLNKVHSKVIN